MTPPADLIPVPRRVTPEAGVVFALSQPWRQEPESAFRPGRVRLTWTPESLLVKAELEDDDVRTSATAHSQRMWELGDVLEMFLQVEGCPDYVELHVTPNGKRLHLCFPGAVPGDPGAFDAVAAAVPRGWVVEATVPSGVLSLERFAAGQELRVSFCRYDAGTTSAPVLSTCANHPVVSFHRPAEWPRVVLAD